MPLRPSPATLAFFHGQHSVFAATLPSSAISTPPPRSRQCCVHTRNSFRHDARRRYATVKSSRSGTDDSSPPSWPTKPHPTPYDIFAMPQQGPYTKKRFYQLVKLYHPDIHSSASQNHSTSTSSSSSASSSDTIIDGKRISSALRLERYHLIVAANDLLSDPSKRHLYDTYGLGWTTTPTTLNDELRARDRSWRDQPGNAAMNATWEDWERWHAAREGRQQPGGFYMPNSVFATIVAMLCAVGALAQGRRAETAGTHYVDVTAQQHRNVSDDVMRSTRASAGMSQEERVERFLRDRENVAFQFEARRYEEDGEQRHGQPQLPPPPPPRYR